MCMAHFHLCDPHYVPSLHFSFFYGEVIVFFGRKLPPDEYGTGTCGLIWNEGGTMYVTGQEKVAFYLSECPTLLV
jgi:hypothetical protein